MADWGKINDVLLNRYPEMLLEELIEGTEITVPILGSDALPIVEIIPPEGQVFDYDNKYNGLSEELCPPRSISMELQEKAKQLALRVHKIAGCRHYSRTDMIIDKHNNIYVLETNTLPGMTDESLFPKSAKAAGISMQELCERLINLATTH
jgi:D-alanine-D-alanine ligase